jgi:hypothetical protein
LDIKPYQDCINICYDNAGAIYEIPNYCINDPYEYNIQTSKGQRHRPAEKKITVKVRKVVEETVIEGTSCWTVLELKKSIRNIGSLQIANPEKVRLFFGGKELQNSEQLWFYNIDSDSIIQLLYNS